MDKFLQALESLLIDFDCESIELKKDLELLICSKGKRIRPRLGYLMLLASGEVVKDSQMELLAAGELLHTASLIHDDIIDDAIERRGEQSLNKKYDSKLAVIAGDLLAAVAIRKIQELGNSDIQKTFLETFQTMCNAEIVQYFSRGSFLDIETYLEKTKNKTALLFSSILEGVALLSEKMESSVMSEFGLSFGFAFQIRNDLNSFLSEESDDKKNKIYTAPDIFMSQGISKELSIEKTEFLIDNEKQKMKGVLDGLQESVYKTSLIEIVEGL